MASIPLKVLLEAETHTVLVETKTGETARGYLANVEDSMNLLLTNVTWTSASGQVEAKETVFLRGSMIRFIQVPDMLRNAPVFAGKRGVSASKAVLRGK